MDALVEKKNYSPEQLDDAEKVLEAYAKLPESKKPILLVIINALISGMEIQEALADKQ